MSDKQKTLKQEVSFSGKGLHTGQEVNLTVKPAPEDYGYKFVRVDLEEAPVIPAVAENVIDTSRGTVISSKEVRVSTIEHVLAALYALGVDNALLEVDGPEVPILDGSSKPFVKAFIAAGFKEQEKERLYFDVTEKISYINEDRGINITVYPDETLNFDVKIGYDSPFLKNQYATLDKISDFAKDVSSCRTFCFFREIEFLAQENLIKGGDLDNAIVIVDHDVTQDEIDRISKLFNHPNVKVEKQGVLNNLELKYDNEPARHKLLDLIGDLALCGAPVRGRVTAEHPGHYANVEFAKILRAMVKKERGRPQPPKIDLYAKPVVDIEGIKQRLPHRYPFQLIDKIMKLTGNEVVGVKNVTSNEPFFQGHFPEESIMPGVLQLEAVGQCGGVLALSTVPDPEKYSTYFMAMDKIKYRRKVVPGDILVFRARLLSPIRRGIVHMRAEAFVGEELAMEGELMAQIIKNKDLDG